MHLPLLLHRRRRALAISLLFSSVFVGACGSSAAEAPPVHAGHHGHHAHDEHHGHHHGSHGECESCQHARETGTEGTSTLVPPGEAQVGDRTRCPVSGEEFVVVQNSPSVQHEGKTYYFCCAGCLEQFNASPERYLQ